MYKGDLEGFPKEVVEKMLDYQEKQGNKRDVSVFEEFCSAAKCYGGFDWDKTDEGVDFWSQVIPYKNFDLFFEKFDKRQKTFKNKHMEVVKTRSITLKKTLKGGVEVIGATRTVTLVGMFESDKVRVGYAIASPEDTFNAELGVKIARGRALTDKTNLVDMHVGVGMNEKYILHAILDNIFKKLERGLISVKGFPITK